MSFSFELFTFVDEYFIRLLVTRHWAPLCSSLPRSSSYITLYGPFYLLVTIRSSQITYMLNSDAIAFTRYRQFASQILPSEGVGRTFTSNYSHHRIIGDWPFHWKHDYGRKEKGGTKKERKNCMKQCMI